MARLAGIAARNMQLKPFSLHQSRLPTLALLALATFSLTGCQSAGYYAQAVRGHCQILTGRESCKKLIADPKTSDELKAKLQLAGQICDFAARELHLPANGHYRHYADLRRPYAVWNVYAAPEFSLAAKTWWYPMVGRLEYRGYFAEPSARSYADTLARKGFDSFVEGVEAYSTLGWFKDPLLNTFLHHPPAALAEILFHELAHQNAFASGDTDFNEAFATTVGQEGVRRWLRARHELEMLERYEASLQRHGQFVQLVIATCARLERLYGDERAADGSIKPRLQTPTEELQLEWLRAEKRRILETLRRDYEVLKAGWGGYGDYDDWFTGELNNAQLSSMATYHELVPAFERLLEACRFDLTEFYAAVKRLERLPKAERHHQLQFARCPTELAHPAAGRTR